MENEKPRITPDYSAGIPHDGWTEESHAWLDVEPTREDMIEATYIVDGVEDLKD